MTFTFKLANSGNTYTIIGDGVNTANSSGTYSCSEINGATAALDLKDAINGSYTAYLLFSNSNIGSFAAKSPLTSAFQIGQFVATDTGSLQVTISPQGAVSAGAEWQLDAGVWQHSGATLSGVSVGSHNIAFSTVSGYTTPTNETVSISTNSTGKANGTYIAIPQTGSLEVTISPAAAITAGAQWQVDGGSFQNSGATVTNLSTTNHILSFNTISGWITPSNQVISIKAKSVVTARSTYSFSAQGIYNGIFAVAETNIGSSGMLNALTVSESGTFTGKLLIGNITNSISGGFNVSGQSSNYVQRIAKQGWPVILQMTLNWTNSPPYASGTVSGTNGGPWTANLTAELEAKRSSSAEYTGVMLPAGTAPGYGYILITNNAGAVTLSGALADGTSFNEQVPVSGDGDLPVYGNLYGGSGLLLGWVGLESGSPAGTLAWIKESSSSSALYTNGFTNMVFVQGSPWTNPPLHTAAIDLPLGQLLVSGGGLASNLTFNVAVSTNNALVKLPGSPTNSLTGTITAKTGLLTITFGNGVGKGTNGATGAVLQNATNAARVLPGKNQCGFISPGTIALRSRVQTCVPYLRQSASICGQLRFRSGLKMVWIYLP